MNALDDVAPDYVRLGLALDRHLDGFVDAYVGPADLRLDVDRGPLPEPERLAEDAERLLDRIGAGREDDPQRARWLAAQAAACRTVAARLAGEPMSWEEEVERCFAVTPERVSEATFEEAHGLLDAALPAGGSLRERYAAWVDAQLVPPERLLAAAEHAAELLRAETRVLVELPADEGFELELVEDEPWLAFNFYLGDLRSRVALNRSAPVWAPWLTEMIAHELYPGHHTERALKEQLLVRERGLLEETIVLTLTPQSVVAEGIATTAFDVLLGDDAHALAAERLRPLGLSYDAERAAPVERAEKLLEGLLVNAARMIHQDGVPVEDVREYVDTWSLKAPAMVDQLVAFVLDPEWRAYAATYLHGRMLCRRYVDGSRERFVELLTRQLTPDDLTP